jgi:uncharacterized protein (DUF488 family)
MPATVTNLPKTTTIIDNLAKKTGASVGNQSKNTTIKDNQSKQNNVSLTNFGRDILLICEDSAKLMTEDSRYIIVEKTSSPAIDNQPKN